MADMPVAKRDFVPLEPFVHQVGGHSSMMKFDDVSVCKPLNQREHRFYEELLTEMHPFTPEYRGVVYVSFKEDDEGYIHLTAHPDKMALEGQNKDGSVSHQSLSSDSDSGGEGLCGSPPRRSPRIGRVESVDKGPYRVRLRSGKLELVNSRKDGLFDADDMPEHSSSDFASHGWPAKHGNRTGHFLGWNNLYGSGANPWSLHCHKKEMNKMRELSSSSKIHKFLVLENVTYQFAYPCILDLKMGTRQHGDDATSEKRDKQIEKVEKSTSKTLGIRACGMQVYQQNSGKFLCRNKYYGRKLCEEGFKRELVTFLHNGLQLRMELIEPLLQKLRRLYKVIEKQHSFRFYSSSLLLMYEGDKEKCDKQPSGCCMSDNDQDTCQAVKEFSRTSSSSSINRKTHSNHYHRSCKVDVRMIDFAHTTHSGFSGDCPRTGPDTGFLFGLKNLIRLLEEIQDIYRETPNVSQESIMDPDTSGVN